MPNKRKADSPQHQKASKANKKSLSPKASPPKPQTMSKNSLENWLKAIQSDLQKVWEKNFDLEKTVIQLRADAEVRESKIELLEEALLNKERDDNLKKIDDEAQTLMLSGFDIQHYPINERSNAFRTYLQNTLPALNNDLQTHQPDISFNAPGARHPTAFLKFKTKKAAFSTAKKFSNSDKKSHSLRSCIPKDVREKKDKTLKEFKDDPDNNGWICQVTLGKGPERDLLHCKRAKDDGTGTGSRITDWELIKTIPSHKERKPPARRHIEDPELLTLACAKLDPKKCKE